MVMKCIGGTFPTVAGLSISIQAYKNEERRFPGTECSYMEMKTLTLKSITVAKIFMQMQTNRFNHIVIKVGALIFAKERHEKQ